MDYIKNMKNIFKNIMGRTAQMNVNTTMTYIRSQTHIVILIMLIEKQAKVIYTDENKTLFPLEN